jgi:hypothetical protein
MRREEIKSIILVHLNFAGRKESTHSRVENSVGAISHGRK